MKRQVFCLTSAALMMLALTGCGGGSGSDDGVNSEITRELLTGGSVRTWKLVSIRGNANYEGSGVDIPCAASLKQIKDPRLSFRCGTFDLVVMREIGTFTYLGVGVDWSLNGSTVALNLGSGLGVLTSSASLEPPTADGRRRIRLRQISRVAGGVRNMDEDGSEIVIQEVEET
jgi:hypothetical protein